MKILSMGMFDTDTKLQIESLNQRLARSKVINANIANSETPGFRAIGYDFEEQIQSISDANQSSEKMKVSDSRHFLHSHVLADSTILADVYVEPTESVGQDGNTVDMEQQMASLAKNQILYRAAVQTINKQLGMANYAINGGR